MNLHGQELLDAIRYLPTIRSRQAELNGYHRLRDATKDQVHPMVALGKLGRLDDAPRVLAAINDKVGPCFLDLNTTPYQTCGDWEHYCNPEGNYQAWRELAAEHPGIMPVALLRESATERPFVRQVILIERDHGVVVIRSRRPLADLPALQSALSAVDDVNNVLVVLDFGYVRGALEARETEARRVISSLRTVAPATRVVVMGSSFPRAVSAYGDQAGTLDIIERDLHLRIGGDEVAIYGDHASIYPEPFEPSMGRFVPRVDYCLDYSWLYRRRREDDGGYVACARQVVESPDWEPEFANKAWGAEIIRITAATGAVQKGFGSPANWIAARVNMHIERQAELAAVGPGGVIEEDLIDDLLEDD